MHRSDTPVPMTARRPSAVALAVSLVLLAAAQPAVAQDPAKPATGPALERTNADSAGPAKPATADLEEVVVSGVRYSQMRSIEIKRLAPSIMDSISAENIGQLPDVTITDSLQRITGVQISRDGGVGTTLNVRGLPQVGTMLNGEVFITPDQIDSQQPDFTTLPATLFSQVDVIKAATAALTAGGISGSVDLHTNRPWNLPSGFTYNYSANAERGSVTKKTGPEASGLVSFNDDGRWGLLVSADFSDTTRANSSEGLDSYGAILHGENAASAGGYNGFLGAWNGSPLPSSIRVFPDQSVDVNGDGKSNGVFIGSQNININQISTERRREAGNASLQVKLDHGLSLTGDYFYAHQEQHDRNVGIQFNSTNWQGATYVPLHSRDTGSTTLGQYNTPPADPNWAGSHIYSTQVYQKWPGDVESYSSGIRHLSTAQNANLQLDYDNGGPFKASVRGIHETARQEYIETDVNISDSDGCLWADPNSSLPCGTFVFPAQLGGNRVFNATGIPQNTLPITADFRGRYLTVGLPSTLATAFGDPNAWRMKTLESNEDYQRTTTITALRFDGDYSFSDALGLKFGVRGSRRDGSNHGFTLVAPVYAGIGASDPNGCLVRYLGADVILSGNSSGTWCQAGNASGAFRGSPISALPLSKTPAPLANNFQRYNNLLGSGINFWGINPRALDDPMSYWKSLYPTATTQASPSTSWDVGLKEMATYLQTEWTSTVAGMKFSGNLGVRWIHTQLDVTQYLIGLPGQYGTEAALASTAVTRRSYNDVLPALNLALSPADKWMLRFAASKNMMPLNLSQWGGGLQLGYSLLETAQGPIYQVSQGSSTGNPHLNPWRSNNYGLSAEFYPNPQSMIGLELFRIDVQSFIKSGAVTNCNLPDEDGVVRNHCVAIVQPLQGEGNTIQGAELDYRQAFTFLPGVLRNTGVEFNFTYAPSNSGQRDLAGQEIPFQDNSAESGNLILWYQDRRFQTRVAYNYRSRRAVQDSVGGITGMEMYEEPQHYLDASMAYKFDKRAELFVEGTNLTNEAQRYYLVWKDQPAHSTFSERMYVIGLRGQW